MRIFVGGEEVELIVIPTLPEGKRREEPYTSHPNLFVTLPHILGLKTKISYLQKTNYLSHENAGGSKPSNK